PVSKHVKIWAEQGAGSLGPAVRGLLGPLARYAAGSSLANSISWAKTMSCWPPSKRTVKSLRPRFSRSETSVPGVAQRTMTPGSVIARAKRQRVPGRIDMAVPSGGSGGEGGQIEPRPFERPTETHVAPVHHPDDGGDNLGLRARVLGDRIHEIEERDVPYHCRALRLGADRKFDARRAAKVPKARPRALRQQPRSRPRSERGGVPTRRHTCRGFGSTRPARAAPPAGDPGADDASRDLGVTDPRQRE